MIAACELGRTFSMVAKMRVAPGRAASLTAAALGSLCAERGGNMTTEQTWPELLPEFRGEQLRWAIYLVARIVELGERLDRLEVQLLHEQFHAPAAEEGD